MEKLMKNSYFDKSSIEYEALNLTLFFWQVYDMLLINDLAEIFSRLYLSPKHFNKTYLSISMECNISLSTLSRCRKRFVKSFSFALSYLENNLSKKAI